MKKKYVLLIMVLALIPLGWKFRGEVRCYALYPECNPLLAWRIPAPRQWQIPMDPVEKAAYDYSHALKLPPEMPQPVPFDFRAARIAEGYGKKSVAQQYFEHLCRTEDVEVIHAVAKDVDGFQVLRPRGWMETLPINHDRYGAEEPTGYGWMNDDDQLSVESIDDLHSTYVQPLNGIYQYVEFVPPGRPDVVVRVDHNPAPDIKNHPFGIESNCCSQIRAPSYRVPQLAHRIEVPALTSRYIYTWRGLRRLRDREFGIGGGGGDT